MSDPSRKWQIIIMVSWVLTLFFILLWGATKSKLTRARIELSKTIPMPEWVCKPCECKSEHKHAISQYGDNEKEGSNRIRDNFRFINIDDKGNVYAICVNKGIPNEK